MCFFILTAVISCVFTTKVNTWKERFSRKKKVEQTLEGIGL